MSEWDISSLSSQRRAYLDGGYSFEIIAKNFASEARILRAWLKAYETADPGDKAALSAYQACFRVRVSQQTFDLLYNSADGMRGRYWQSPDAGHKATKLLIGLLRPSLIRFAESERPQLVTRSRHARDMSLIEVGMSLDAFSAKVWVGEEVLAYDQSQLVVQRWADNEGQEIEGLRGKNGPRWRCAPVNGEIEVKGALIDPDGGEHIPISKVRRSEEVHYFGFT